jgi:hypothetical protein
MPSNEQPESSDATITTVRAHVLVVTIGSLLRPHRVRERIWLLCEGLPATIFAVRLSMNFPDIDAA